MVNVPIIRLPSGLTHGRADFVLKPHNLIAEQLLRDFYKTNVEKDQPRSPLSRFEIKRLGTCESPATSPWIVGTMKD